MSLSPEAKPGVLPGRELVVWGGLLVVALVLLATTWWRQTAPPLPVLGQVQDFALTRQDGGPLTRQDLLGKPWVASFTFTRCPAICPRMNAELQRVDRVAAREVRLVSFSVDPVHDTPAILAAQAQSLGASARWFFLTGPEPTIHALTQNSFKLAVVPATADAPLVHSTHLVLVDAAGAIRGYYEAFAPGSIDRLLQDLERLLQR